MIDLCAPSQKEKPVLRLSQDSCVAQVVKIVRVSSLGLACYGRGSYWRYLFVIGVVGSLFEGNETRDFITFSKMFNA